MPRQPFTPPGGRREFSVAEACAAGISAGRLRGSDLSRPFHGVRIVGNTTPDLLARCRALHRRLIPQAWFSGPTAAVLMGVPLPPRLERQALVHVSVPAPHRAPSGRGIIGHTSEVRPEELRDWNGISLSGPERVWCELAPELELADLVAAGDFLIHHRLPMTHRGLLAAMVESSSLRRGKVRARSALGLLHDRSESRRESIVRVILVTAGLTGLAVNLPITTSGGYSYRADLAFPAARVIIEYQSDFHRDPDRYRKDMTRRSRLEADGWFVIEINADDLGNPAELVARVSRVLAGRV